MSAMLSGLWVTHIQQLNGNESRETDKQVDGLICLPTRAHTEFRMKHELDSTVQTVFVVVIELNILYCTCIHVLVHKVHYKVKF